MESLLLLLFVTVNGITFEIERPVQDDIHLLGLPDDVITTLNNEPCETAGQVLADHLRNRYTNTGGIPLEITWRCEDVEPDPTPAPSKPGLQGAPAFDLEGLEGVELPGEPVGPPKPGGVY